MNDLGVHLVLFALVTLGIVVCSAFYGEPDDAKALQSLPKRFLVFCGGCAALAVVVLVIEHTVARVS